MLDPDAKVQRITLSEQVEGFIRDHIISRKLAPGQTLPSSVQLAEQFGVSRTIVREAMKSLEAKGMVTIVNGKRPIVSPLNNQVLVDFFSRVAGERDAALIELLELRRGIEVQGAALAAERRTDEELAELWAITRQMRASMREVERYLDHDVDLHLAIAKASHNRMIFHLVDSIRGPVRDTQREGQDLHPAEAMKEQIQTSHEILVQLIDEQDATEAARCMAIHFDGSIEGIQRTRAELPLLSTDWGSLFPAQFARVVAARQDGPSAS